MPSGLYIQVILPLRLEWEPCYYTDDSTLRIGRRVEVNFAGRRYIAVVSGVGVTPEVDASKIKPVLRSETGLDDITEEEIELWRWMAAYYLCTAGEVYKAAYPAVKTLGEEVAARAEERQEALRQRVLSLYLKRLEAVQKKIASKQLILAHKKNKDTKLYADGLEALRRYENEAEALRKRVNAASAASESQGGLFQARGKRKEAASKPLLLTGPKREEQYIPKIQKEIEEGRNVLILVPEIERTVSLKETLQGRFPGEFMLFHSALPAGKRRDVADELRSGSPCVVLGTRSALFLPLGCLGLVIVEDEHDPSYKQSDKAPRYNGRDTAIALASICKADVILGSVCPSLESLYNAMSGKYRMAETTITGEGTAAGLIDTGAERRKRGMAGPLSFKLLEAVGETAAKGERSLILCPPRAMEEIDERLKERLPSCTELVKVSNIYTSKWLDEDNVGLVALVEADSLLSRADFRADERAMQALAVFRSMSPQGRFIVQTARGDHPVYAHGTDSAKTLLKERQDFGFPPFSRIVDCICIDSNEKRRALMISEFASMLKGRCRVPVQSLPDRVRVIIAKDRQLTARKEALRDTLAAFEGERRYSGHFHLDVDPA